MYIVLPGLCSQVSRAGSKSVCAVGGTLTILWFKYWVETTFWAKMRQVVSDVSVKTSIFQPCSFISSLITVVHSRSKGKVCPYQLRQTSNLQGGEGKSKFPEETAGRVRGVCLLCTFLPVFEIHSLFKSISLECFPLLFCLTLSFSNFLMVLVYTDQSCFLFRVFMFG